MLGNGGSVCLEDAADASQAIAAQQRRWHTKLLERHHDYHHERLRRKHVAIGQGNRGDPFIVQRVLALDAQQIGTLQSEFEKGGPAGLTKTHFIAALIVAMGLSLSSISPAGGPAARAFASEEADEQQVLVLADLCELFSRLDSKKAGVVGWGTMLGFLFGEREVAAQQPWTYDEPGPAFALRSRVILTQHPRQSCVHQIRYFDQPQRFVVVEANRCTLSVFDEAFTFLFSMSTTGRHHQDHPDRPVVAVAWLAEPRQFCVTTTTCALLLFAGDTGKLVKQLRSPGVETHLAWVEAPCRTLFSAENLGALKAWDVDTGTYHAIADGDREVAASAATTTADDFESPLERPSHREARWLRSGLFAPTSSQTLDSQQQHHRLHRRRHHHHHQQPRPPTNTIRRLVSSQQHRKRRLMQAAPRMSVLLALRGMGLLACASSDSTISVYDASEVPVRRKAVLEGHTSGVTDMAFSERHRLLISCAVEALLWSPTQCSPVLLLSGRHHHPLCSVGALRGGEHDRDLFVTVDRIGGVCVWDARFLTCVQTLRVHQDGSWSRQGDYEDVLCLSAQLAVVGLGRLDDQPTNRVLHVFEPAPFDAHEGSATPSAHDGPPIALACDTESGTAWTACAEALRTWDLRTGQLLRTLNLVETDQGASTVRELTAVYAQRGRVLLGREDGDVVAVDATTRAVLQKLLPPPSSCAASMHVVDCPERGLVVSAGRDRSLRVHGRNSRHARVPCSHVVHDAHESEITALACSEDFALVASGAADGTLRLWDLGTGHPCGECVGHSRTVTGAAFVPALKLLVSSSTDQTVRLWTAVGGVAHPTVELGRLFTAAPALHLALHAQRPPSALPGSGGGGDDKRTRSSTLAACMVCVGDDSGMVQVWDLLPLLRRAEFKDGVVTPVVPVDDHRAATSPTSSCHVLARALTVVTLTPEEPQAELELDVAAELQAALHARWQAHTNDAVVAVALCALASTAAHQPRAVMVVLSASPGGCVKVWSSSGEPLGCLSLQGQSGPWPLLGQSYDARCAREAEARELFADVTGLLNAEVGPAHGGLATHAKHGGVEVEVEAEHLHLPLAPPSEPRVSRTSPRARPIGPANAGRGVSTARKLALARQRKAPQNARQ